MKLRLPHKFQAALMAAIASVSFTTLSTGTAYSAELNEIITMNEALVNSATVKTAAVNTAWEMADGERVYSFNGSQYIGGISAEALTTALGNNEYITVAAWINPTAQTNDSMGSIFGYGGQGNGIMLKDVSGHLRVTTKGKADINFDQTGIDVNSWELVAVTFHMSNSSTLEARVMLNEQAYDTTKSGGIYAADPNTFSIGSGNSEGNARDAFRGSIGGLKVFTSNTWASYSDVAGLMSAAPTELLHYARPIMTGPEFTWVNGHWENSSGTQVDKPTRSNSLGPVLIVNNSGTVTNSAGSEDTSDGGGIRVTGDSNFTTKLGGWAGYIYVGEGSALSVSYDNKIKSLVGAGSNEATVYVDGTLAITGRNNLTINDGSGDHNWYIGEKGFINLSGITQVSKAKNWNIQVAVEELPDIQGYENRTLGSITRQFMSTGADLSGSVNSWKVFMGDKELTVGTESADNYTIGYANGGFNVTYGYGSVIQKMTLTWKGGEGTWAEKDSTMWLNDGKATSFANGDDVIFGSGSNTANVSGNLTVGSLTVDVDGTLTVQGGAVTVQNAMALSSSNRKITVGDGGVFTLSTNTTIDDNIVSTGDKEKTTKAYRKMYEGLAVTSTGTGKVVWDGSINDYDDGLTGSHTYELGYSNMKVTGNVKINGNAREVTWAVGSGKSLEIGGNYWLSNKQYAEVNGGTLTVGGNLKLAHESNSGDGGYLAKLTATNGANVTLDGIEFVGGGNIVTISNSTLTFTKASGNVLSHSGANVTKANTVTLNNATLVAQANGWSMSDMTGNDLTTVAMSGDTTVNVGNGNFVSITATTFTDGTIIKQGAGYLTFAVYNERPAKLNKAIQVQGGTLVLSGTFNVDGIAPDAGSSSKYYNYNDQEANSGFRQETQTKTVFTLADDASIEAWSYATFTNNGVTVEPGLNGKFTVEIPTDYTTLWVNGTDTASYTTYATAAQGKGQVLTGVQIADGATLTLDTTTPVSEGIITVQSGTANIQMESGSSMTADNTARNIRLSGAGTYTTTSAGLKAGVSTAAEGGWTGTIDARAVDSSSNELFNLYTSTAIHGGTVLLKTVTGDPTSGADTQCLTMQLGDKGKSSKSYTFAQTTFKTEKGGNLKISDYSYAHSWIVGSGTTLDIAGGIRMDHKQTLSIQGGTVTTGGEIVLGHTQSGTSPSGLAMTAGSLRTSGIHVIANSATASDVSITGGTVEFTAAGNALQINTTATVTLGGSGSEQVTLKAVDSSWTFAYNGMTVGNIAAETAEGRAITLGGTGMTTQYTGAITVADGSSLVLDGIVAASGTTQASGIDVTGTLALNDNVKFDLSTFTGTGSDEEGYSYTVFSGTGATGLFDKYAFSVVNITGVDITGKDWKFNDGTISYTLSTTFTWGNEAGTGLWNYVDQNWGEGNAFRENGTAQFFQTADVTVDTDVVANTIVVGDTEHQGQVTLSADGDSTLSATTLQVDNGTIATNLTLAGLQNATVAEGSTWTINAAQTVGTAGTFNGALVLDGSGDLDVNGSFTLGENATIDMKAGSRLKLSDASVAKRLMTGDLLTESQGTLVVDADVTLNNNESATATGKLVMKDHLLKMGAGETQTVSLASFSSVELDNAQILSQTAHDTIHNLTVGAGKTGTFVSIDMDNGDDAVYQFDGATSVGAGGTLTIANYWNAQVNLAALVGDGTLKVMGNANTTGISPQTGSKQEIVLTVGSLSTADASFTGDLVIDHKAENNQDSFTINTGSRDVSFRSLSVNYDPNHAKALLAFNLGADATIDLMTLTSGAVNVGGAGMLTVHGLSGSGALTIGGNAGLTVNVAGEQESAYAGNLTVLGGLVKDGAGALALNGTGNAISSTIDLKNGSLALNGTFDLSGFSHVTTYSGGAKDTNGFVLSISDIQLVDVKTGGTLSQGTGASFLVDNVSVTLNTDSSSAGYGHLSYTQDNPYSTFYVNNGSTDKVSNAAKAPTGTLPTISLSNGSTLVADTADVTLSTDNISLASGASATLQIDSGVTVNAGSTNKSLNLTGEGIYMLAPGAPNLKGVTLDNSNWTGIVMVNSYAPSKTVIDFSAYAKANSYVGLSGVSGVDAKWSGSETNMETLNFYLVDKEDGTAAWNWNDGAGGGATMYFAGKMAGSGTLKKTKAGVYNNFVFTNNVGAWTGKYLLSEANAASTVTFKDGAKDVAVSIENESNQALNVVFSNSDNVTMSGDVKKTGTGALNVTVGANTTFSGSVQATALTVNDGKSATFNGTLNAGGAITLNGSASLTLAGETTIAQAIAGTATSTVTISHDITTTGLARTTRNYNVGLNDEETTGGDYFTGAQEGILTVVTGGGTVTPGDHKVIQDNVAYTLKANGTAVDVIQKTDYTKFYLSTSRETPLTVSQIAAVSTAHDAVLGEVVVSNEAALGMDTSIAKVTLDTGILNISNGAAIGEKLFINGGSNVVYGSIDTSKLSVSDTEYQTTGFSGAPVQAGGVSYSQDGAMFVMVTSYAVDGAQTGDETQYSIESNRFHVIAAQLEMTAEDQDVTVGNVVRVSRVHNSVEGVATGKLTLDSGAYAATLKEVIATSGNIEFYEMDTDAPAQLAKLDIAAGKSVSFYSSGVNDAKVEASVTVSGTLTAGSGASLNSDLNMASGSTLDVNGAQDMKGLIMGSKVTLNSDSTLDVTLGEGATDSDLLYNYLTSGHEFYYLFDSVEALTINGQDYDKIEFNGWDKPFVDASTVYSNLNSQTFYVTYNGANVGTYTLAIGLVPEPTTGTLSLLALAALAARRRRK